MFKNLLVCAGLVFCSQAAIAEPFGDAVTRCVAKYGLPLDSPKLYDAFALCENQVEDTRRAQQKTTPSIEKADAFLSCLKTSATRLDDQISPASEIASGALNDCQSAYIEFLVALDQLEKAKEYPSTTTSQTALRIVLEARASTRAASAKQKR